MYYRLNNFFVYFIGVRTIGVPVSNFIKLIKEHSEEGVTIHAISAKAVYSVDHLLGVLKITLECDKRNIIVSTKPEIDLLLRLSLTNQIKFALNHAGINALYPVIIIIYSPDKKKVAKSSKRIIKTIPHIDHTVLRSYRRSREVFRLLGITERNHISLLGRSFVTQYLIERSALIIK